MNGSFRACEMLYSSVPARFDPRRSFIHATVLGTALFALLLINQHFGWITPAMLDLTGAG